MANPPGGSFIPKRPQARRSSPTKAGRRVYVFSYVAFVVFFGTLLSSGGIYFLKERAAQQLEEHALLLEAERTVFNQAEIDEIRSFDEQLQLAMTVLDSHTAFSKVFEELEQFTAAPVQFAGLDYTREVAGGTVLTLDGLTESFDVLLFQREALQQSELFGAAKFVNVSYGSAATLIEGADRIDPQTSQTQFDRVTFTFESDAFADKIGYEARTGGVLPFEIDDSDDVDNTSVPESDSEETESSLSDSDSDGV